MSSFVLLDEAQSHLAELLDQMLPGEKRFLTRKDGQVIATLVKELPFDPTPRQAGAAAHIPHYMAEDFNAPLEDFKEYME